MRLNRLIFLSLLTLAVLIPFALSGCGDDDDDNDSDNLVDDDADDDSDDDGPVVPTTVDVAFMPVRDGDTWKLGEAAGEPHAFRNDLNVEFGEKSSGEPMSMAYFMTLSDIHFVDEESPTRLTFFDAMTLLGGAFDSAYRPQEDLAPFILNALVRTANQIQADYDRDFDFMLNIGDSTDNAQTNEMKLLIDVLDGNALTSGEPGYARPDSGDLDIDPSSGLNNGERDFGIQEQDADGNNINLYNRPGYPNSNMDFPVAGLKNTSGSLLNWYYSIGNHDVLNTGNFNPDSPLTFYSKDDYVADVCHYGYIPGLGGAVAYYEENPWQSFFIDGGIFGLNLDWNFVIGLLGGIGLIPDDYSVDVYEQFDLMTLLHDTPEDPSDDGVAIAPDPERAFMGRDNLMSLINENGHGFADHNSDGMVDHLDGGYYSMDLHQMNPALQAPVRFLFIDATEDGFVADGGITPYQLQWIKNELDRAVEDQVLVIAVSHHHEDAISNAGDLQKLFHACPNFIMHLVGHGHYNYVKAHSADDGDPLHGYWEVETPSSIDFPQQSRIIELVDNRDGTGAVFLTVFDHWDLEGDDSDTLALLGRELAFADVLREGYDGTGHFGHMGGITDRNVKLIFAIPDEVAAKLAKITNDYPITSGTAFGAGDFAGKMKLTDIEYKIDENGVRAEKKSMSQLIDHLVEKLDADEKSGLRKHLTDSLKAAPKEDDSDQAYLY